MGAPQGGSALLRDEGTGESGDCYRDLGHETDLIADFTDFRGFRLPQRGMARPLGAANSEARSATGCRQIRNPKQIQMTKTRNSKRGVTL